MLMAAGESAEAEHRLSACCISHEFFKAACRFPDKIAVVHASGFTGIVHDSAVADRPRDGGGIDFSERLSSSVPPSYDGDECFTFSDILSAVEYLSSKLRHILDGGEDPDVITTGPANSFSEKSIIASESLQASSQFGQQSTQSTSAQTPKVLGIYMEPCVEYIVAVLSILRCGEAFLPLDPTWPKARILSILSTSNADLVVGIDLTTERNCFHRLDTLKWLIEEGCCPILPVSMKDCSKRQSFPIQFDWRCKREPLRLFCYLIYTSGSSGKPKGVCGTEKGLLNRFLWMQEMYPPDEGDVVLFKTAISFIDHMQEFLGAILSTCTLVIPPFNRLKENMFYVIDYLQGYSINRFVAVPSLIMRVILPSLQSQQYAMISSSLKLLVLSGEVLHIPLCKMLLKLLPKTVILNLYGSTEVTGDCTYFDCRRLPLILEKEIISSVPIGLPLSNCDVVLVGEDAPHLGEIYVGGLCVAAGYFRYPYLMSLADGFHKHDIGSCPDQSHFKTGDFAKRLPSGDLVFLGRKDRIIKVNGQRIALEEIEGTLRDHPGVLGAAVLSREGDGEVLFLEAHVMTERAAEDYEIFRTSLRHWLMRNLPQMMIPSQIFFVQSLPFTSSGKVDYLSLAASTASDQHARINIEEISEDQLLQVIKQGFCDALMVEKVSVDDDFFMMGGNSISAAYASFKFGIHMKLLYTFPTPRSLQMALLSSSSLGGTDARIWVDLKRLQGMALSMDAWIPYSHGSTPQEKLSEADSSGDIPNPAKKLKTAYEWVKNKESFRHSLWNPTALHSNCSFRRCNNSVHGGQCEVSDSCGTVWSNVIPTDGKGFIQELWKVDMGSCVDASPLVVCKGSDVYLFIGSHSHKFVCIDGKSGVVRWETKLEGRVECSSEILDDFSQVVVGCYYGNIYFLHFSKGSICWSFQTNGEVKSQPVVDRRRHLVWCGSYDHNLYALDYKGYSCIYRLPCEGSIFGSPAIDEIQEKLYVASTSGHVTALEIKTPPFKVLWKKEMGAPIFSSLAVNHSDGNVICCSVDGSVAVLDKCGSTVWKVITGGPIFAGPCTSRALPSQLLVCSRDGNIYSLETATGDLIWKHAIRHPITSSPYVDENSQLMSSIASPVSARLICVSDSSGIIHVLKFSSCGSNTRDGIVEEFAQLDLQGDIFSSPVMIGGRIFVGCRDDCVYCIELDVELLKILGPQVNK